MAVVEIDARLEAVIFDCPQCGPPKPLTLPYELRDPEKLARDHGRATGHKPKVHKQEISYLTLVIGPSRQSSGPMPRP